MKDTAQSCIYAIRAIGTNRIKIGTTLNLQKRRSSVQTGCPYPVEIVAYWEGDYRLETLIHRYFEKRRKQGEWFEVSIQEIEQAVSFLRRMQGKAAGGEVETMPAALNASLSILQQSLAQLQKAGIQVISKQTPQGMLLLLSGVIQCQTCKGLRTGNCPTCVADSSTEGEA